MVDICVNMGVKPRVHYQKGYPCEDIAELFERQVRFTLETHLQMLQYIANYQPILKEVGLLLLTYV